jgi:hypothetical protein
MNHHHIFHHLTPHRGLLRQVQPLSEPQIFGLVDKKTTRTASEVREVELELPSGQKMILKDVYLIPESRISLISLSRMLRAGWRAYMTGSGGQLKRAKETLLLDQARQPLDRHIGQCATSSDVGDRSFDGKDAPGD